MVTVIVFYFYCVYQDRPKLYPKMEETDLIALTRDSSC